MHCHCRITCPAARRRWPCLGVFAVSVRDSSGSDGEVLFLDRLEPEMCRDAAGNPCGLAESFNLRYFRDVMADFGLSGSYRSPATGAGNGSGNHVIAS